MLSEERLAHWKELAKHPGLSTWRARTACRLPPDDEHAVLLHEWNAAVACSLMMSFQIFEVSLRNHMHDALSDHFRTRTWWGHLQGKLWTASDNLLASQKDDVNKAIEVSARRKKGVTPGGVISELSFGFWLSLIGAAYDNPSAGVTHWRNCLHAVFDKSGKIGRKETYAALEQIIRLRNKCAHHEPIVTLNIDAEHNHLVSVARRFSRATAEWITQTSLTPHIIKPDWYHALRVSGRLIGSPS
jgi:hypothetical protein